jgi:hypothetical protein
MTHLRTDINGFAKRLVLEGADVAVLRAPAS